MLFQQYNTFFYLFGFLFSTILLIFVFAVPFLEYRKNEDLIMKKLLVKWFKFFLLLSSISFFMIVFIGYLLEDTILRKNLIKILEIPMFFSWFFYLTILLHKYLSDTFFAGFANGVLIFILIFLIFVLIIPTIYYLIYHEEIICAPFICWS